jgi:cytochrome c oxidase subunit 1
VTHSLAPADTQQTDTYYIVAHFHYVIFGGGVLGLMSGTYFWWPKIFGFTLDERKGQIHFWLMLIGFNMTFAPQHILGLQGMSRRIDTYSAGFGFELWNMVSTIGSFIIAVSLLVFFYNAWVSTRGYKKNPPEKPLVDPWDARSLEWMTECPTPEHNFDEVPEVESLDEWWHRKYRIEDDGSVTRIATPDEAADPGVRHDTHLPSPSYWPLALAAALPLIGLGLIFNLWLALVGGLIAVMSLFAWALEPVDDPDGPHGHHDDHDDDGDDPDGELAAAGAGAESEDA